MATRWARWLVAAALVGGCGDDGDAGGGAGVADTAGDVAPGDAAAADGAASDAATADAVADAAGSDVIAGDVAADDAVTGDVAADATTADAADDATAPDAGPADAAPGDAADAADATTPFDATEPPIPDECWDDLAPGEAVVFHEAFTGGVEGVAFGPGGALYVTQQGTGQLWRIAADGTSVPFVTIPKALGLAPAPDGGLLVADLGATNTVGTLDGAVWHVDGEGTVSPASDPLGSPNFVLPAPDGSVLVSDDFDTRIFRVAPDGGVTVAVEDIGSPNGLGYSPDRTALYVASTFTADGELTRIPVDGDGMPTDGPRVVLAKLGATALPDGLAVDEHDRVYVAANFLGQIVRVRGDGKGDPVVVHQGMKNPASLAFGAAEGFDPCSVYVTELFQGRVWRLAVGARGVPIP